jgi:hypothetical protein
MASNTTIENIITHKANLGIPESLIFVPGREHCKPILRLAHLPETQTKVWAMAHFAALANAGLASAKLAAECAPIILANLRKDASAKCRKIFLSVSKIPDEVITELVDKEWVGFLDMMEECRNDDTPDHEVELSPKDQVKLQIQTEEEALDFLEGNRLAHEAEKIADQFNPTESTIEPGSDDDDEITRIMQEVQEEIGFLDYLRELDLTEEELKRGHFEDGTPIFDPEWQRKFIEALAKRPAEDGHKLLEAGVIGFMG